MQDNSLQKVAETHVLKLCKTFQHLEQSLFNPDARLHALNFDLVGGITHTYQCTMVHKLFSPEPPLPSLRT